MISSQSITLYKSTICAITLVTNTWEKIRDGHPWASCEGPGGHQDHQGHPQLR